MESLSMRLIPVFDWLLRTTLQAAMLFCLIMLIKLIVRGRLPIRWHYCLWLLLLIRMASPWMPESKISIFNWVPRSIQHGGIIQSLSQPQDARGMGFYMRGGITDEQETKSETATVKLTRFLPLLWLAGGVALAVYVGAANFRLWWLVTRERPLTDQKILDLLEDCKAEMGIRNILGIVTTDKVSSAALFGFVRPRLLLPARMVETLSRQELRFVFMHELGHLRRRDIYIGWLMSLLQVLHWFNPFVWLAFYRMQSDRELACDALVLSYARSGESKEYGRTIVNLLERFSRPQRLPSMAGILETKSQLKRRIKMIAKFKKTTRPRWAGAMLLLAALACIVLTSAYVAKADFIFGTPANLGQIINGSANDAAPSVSADGLTLFFASTRSGGLGGWDIWVATRKTTDDDWGAPINLGPTVNSSAHDSVPCISTDGLSLFFGSTRSGHDIWVTTRTTTADDWRAPVNLGPPVNTPGYEGFPSISADGLELYFDSDRTGDLGGGDIWMSTRETKEHPWSEPVHLGPTVNSQYLEASANISSDGLALFFQSDRPGGHGSPDIWVTRRTTPEGDWNTPVNLGPPVNTSDIDLNPDISFDGSTFYFSSWRSGGFGGNDLWQVRILPVVDLNGDGKVDFKDFRKLAQYWGQNEPSCDIAPLPLGDGIVDEKDLNLLAEHLLKEIQPVAHWRLDETQGDMAYDAIGEKDGSLNGGPLWRPVGGKAGGSLQFDGVDDYVGTPFILDPSKGSFSVFAWIKGSGAGQVIISQANTPKGPAVLSGNAWLGADPSSGALMTGLMDPPFASLASESVVTDGQWHHVGLVYDFSAMHRHLYVDGAQVAADTDYVGGMDCSAGLYIGAGQSLDPATFFSGLIDDVRIYDEVLSAEEVAELAR